MFKTPTQKLNKCKNMDQGIMTIVIVGVVFFVIGFAFTMVALAPLISMSIHQGEYKETEAYIFYVDHVYQDVEVSYSVDGKAYMEKLNYYSSSMEPGDTLSIKYNVDQPSKIKVVSATIIFTSIFGGIGLLFVVIGLIMSLQYLKSDHYLFRHGKYIEAELVTVFGRPISTGVVEKVLWVIECQYFDSETGLKHVFQSVNMEQDPRPDIEKNNITKFIVYVKKNDWYCYVMDLDYLLIPGQTVGQTI